MLQDIVICTLSAAGVLLLIWLLIGHFVLPLDARECSVVLSAHGDAEHLPQQLRACRYLQGAVCCAAGSLWPTTV